MARGQSLTMALTQDLGIAIVTEQFSAQKPLPFEGELCRNYNVSRSVIREAVKMLTAKGLLTSRPRQGTRIAPQESWNLLDPDVMRWILEGRFSLKLLIQLTQARLAFEPIAAATAATSASDADRQAVVRAAGRMLAAARGDDDALEADIEFHIALLRASGNPFFLQLNELVAGALRYTTRRLNPYRDASFLALENKRVADAILAGNPNTAERCVRALVQSSLDALEADEDRTAAGKPSKRTA